MFTRILTVFFSILLQTFLLKSKELYQDWLQLFSFKGKPLQVSNENVKESIAQIPLTAEY